MKKIIFLVLLCSVVHVSFSQTINGDRVIARNAIYLKDRWATAIQNDTAFSSFGSPDKLVTSEAVQKYIAGRIAALGGGTDGLNDITARDSITLHNMIIRGDGFQYFALDALSHFGGVTLINDPSTGGTIQLTKANGRSGTITAAPVAGADRIWYMPNKTGTVAIAADDSTGSPTNMIYQGIDGFLHKAAVPSGGSGSVDYVAEGYGTKVDSSGRVYTVKVDSTVMVNIARINNSFANYINKTMDSSWLTGMHTQGYYDGRYAAAGGSAGWGLTGNSGTNSFANSIGTSDNATLVFNTNGKRRMSIDSLNGMVWISSRTYSPTGAIATAYPLYVSDSIGTHLFSVSNVGSVIIGQSSASNSPYAGVLQLQTPQAARIEFWGSSAYRFSIGAMWNGSVYGASIANGSQFIDYANLSTTFGGTSQPPLSSVVNMQSATKGVLLANKSTTQQNAIASPATGLTNYNTTLKRLTWYDGTAWQYSPIAFSGTAAPTTTPLAVGDTFTDTVNDKHYAATGTTSSADWTILN